MFLTTLIEGAFHSTPNSGNFSWFIKCYGPIRFGPTGIFGTSFKVVHYDPIISVGGTERSLSISSATPVSFLQEQ